MMFDEPIGLDIQRFRQKHIAYRSLISCIQGYLERQAYIATQLPLPETVVDIWRLLYEQKCSCIITLDEPDPGDEVFKFINNKIALIDIIFPTGILLTFIHIDMSHNDGGDTPIHIFIGGISIIPLQKWK